MTNGIDYIFKTERLFPNASIPPKEAEVPLTNGVPTNVERDHFDEDYLIHKISKQVVFRGLFGAAFIPRTFQLYQVYTSLFNENPNQPVFQDRSRMIYQHNNPIGSLMRRILLPKKYLQLPLGETEQTSLHDHGMKNMGRTANVMLLAQIARLIGNIAAWGTNNENHDSNNRYKDLTIGLDTIQAGVWIGFELSQRRAANMMRITNQLLLQKNEVVDLGKPLRSFLLMRHLAKTACGLQVITGGVKMALEGKNYLNDPERADFSAFGDAAFDIGQGGTFYAFQRFLIRSAKKAVEEGNMKQAINIASVSSRVLPRRLLWSMRFFGMSGGAIGLVPNLNLFFKGLAEGAFDFPESSKKTVSGLLGMSSSLFMIAYGYYVTPASLPINAALFAIGSMFLMAQTLYDEQDELREL